MQSPRPFVCIALWAESNKCRLKVAPRTRQRRGIQTTSLGTKSGSIYHDIGARAAHGPAHLYFRNLEIGERITIVTHFDSIRLGNLERLVLSDTPLSLYD